MSATIQLDCPKCGRKIAIRGDSGTIHVTCPACREQWDWPRRQAPPTGATRQATRVRIANLAGRVKGWYRATLLPVRFSGAQLIIASLAAIGFGVILGMRMSVQREASLPLEPEVVSIPVGPDLVGPAATNILNSPGINPKTDDAILTNMQDLDPSTTNQ